MPRQVCCVPGCSIIASDGVPLHYFPNPETFAEKFQVWVKNIGGDIASLDSVTVLKTHRICRRHFETQYLYPKNRLSKLAVPTLLLPSGDISGLKINGARLNHLRFADDLVLLEENPAALEQMMQSLANISREVGLEINDNKTKLMTNSSEIDIMIDGNKIEYVKEYIYTIFNLRKNKM